MIETLHTNIYNLVDAIEDFNGGYYEIPCELTDEKLPTFAVYYNGHTNEVLTSRSNKRSHEFVVDVIFDKENRATTQTVLSELVDDVIDVLEDVDNTTLGGNSCYTEPTTCERIEDYQIAGKHYLGYRIYLNVIINKSI